MTKLLRPLTALLVVLGLAPPALATWSIVVVNRRTGEAGVAAATCLGGKFPLKRWLPVVVVGKGAAAAQSAIDSTGQNRALIFASLQAGETPERILEFLSHSGSHQSRQYGIAAFDGPPVTFTGNGAGEAKLGVVGEIDGLLYAIQGNVLAGDPVILEAERALRDTPGDLVQRMMAAMEVARSLGGDGRCSCSPQDPDGCGTPPPGQWKSAHTAFIVLSRPGDVDGVCNTAEGCASGNYYLERQFNGNDGDPDPVVVLLDKVAQWRANRIGEPDHVLSEVRVDRDALVADGRSQAFVRVRLRDIDGTPLDHGGAVLTLVPHAGTASAVPGPVLDNGDGTYSFPLTATDTPGRGAWDVVVDFGGAKTVQLYPPLALQTDPLVDLHAGRYVVSAAQGGAVPFTLNRGAGEAGRAYRLLGSASGTEPGLDFGDVVLPLNRDRFFQLTLLGGPPELVGTVGALDADGRATARVALSPLGWEALVGSRLHFCALLSGAPQDVTSVVRLDVLP